MLYPLLFKSIYKKMVWGSESWDISCRPNEMGVIENGSLAGIPFNEAIAKDPAAFLGSRVSKTYKEEGFPLLVKIIDAKDDLSVQVHPDDAYAKANNFEKGKSEMWYVMDAPPGQSLIIGIKGDKEMLKKDPMSCLNRLPIKKGDIINIPAGLVHALTKDVIVAEIQQNSDVTFRLYDYNRLGLDGKPRELHIEHGLAAIDIPESPLPFTVIKCEIDGELTEKTDPETFTIFTCVDGSCEISGVALGYGRSVFIPAGLGEYTIKGKAILLKSFV